MLQETPLIGVMRSAVKASSALCDVQMKATARAKYPMAPPMGCSMGCQLLWEKGLFWPRQQQSFSTKGTVMLACWHQITLISIFQSPRGQMTHEVFHVEKKSLRKKQKQEQNRLKRQRGILGIPMSSSLWKSSTSVQSSPSAPETFLLPG